MKTKILLIYHFYKMLKRKISYKKNINKNNKRKKIKLKNKKFTLTLTLKNNKILKGFVFKLNFQSLLLAI